MENSEEILQILERFTEQKAQQIPKELDTYLEYVARTGDSVFKWANIKYLLREKLLHAIKNFNANTVQVEEVPNYPNVDPFNYETMESMLLERFELFNAAPFTIQRLCELLVEPRKHYTRIDKYMRALEKNILVVSTVEPGRIHDNSNGDTFDTLDDVDIELDEQEERTVIAIATKILAENKITPAVILEKEVELSPKRSDKLSNDDKDDDDEKQQPERKKPKLAKENILDKNEERDPDDGDISDKERDPDAGDISDKNDTLGEQTTKQVADNAKEKKQLQQNEVDQSLDEVERSKEDEDDDKEFDENTVTVATDVTTEDQKICSVESEIKAQTFENQPLSQSQVTDKKGDETDNKLTQNVEQTEDSTSTKMVNEKQAEVGDAPEDVEKDEQEEDEELTSGGRTITYTTEIDTPEAPKSVITHHVAIEIEEESSQTESIEKSKEDEDLELNTPGISVQLDANEPNVVNSIEDQREQGSSTQKTEDMEAEEIITTESKADRIEDITAAVTDSEMITDSNEAKLIDNMDIDGDNSQHETMDVL